MELLTAKAFTSRVEYLYRHDVESFIWVLTWVSLRYNDDRLLSNGRSAMNGTVPMYSPPVETFFSYGKS
jgi:hypothetical protein